MSTRTTDDGLTISHRSKVDHRISKGSVGARTDPIPGVGDLRVWRSKHGRMETLHLDQGEAYDLADALDALLEYIETQEG